MPLLKSRRIKSDDEKQLAIGCIVSDNFISVVSNIVDLNLLEVSYIKEVVKWCLEYYKEFNEAPYETIQEIFDSKKEQLKPTDITIIDKFLDNLNEEYIQGEEQYNVEFNIKRASKYLHKQKLRYLFIKGKKYLDVNKVDKADSLVHNHLKYDIIEHSKKPYNSFDIERIRMFDKKREDIELLRFDGALGQLFGPLCRTWFIGLLGPRKRGKTWWLVELGWQGLMRRLKVYFANFEDSEYDLDLRMYQKATALPLESDDDTTYPMFTCMRWHSCNYKFREKQEPCNKCRGNRKRYELGLCRSSPRRGRPKLLSSIAIERKIEKSIQYKLNKNYRCKSYERNIHTLDDVEADLDYLHISEGFEPDIILTDHADIIGPSKHDIHEKDHRDRINNVWSAHELLAERRNALVATVSHSTRKGGKKRTMHEGDTSEDIRKINHVHMMATLNQTVEERRLGILRLGVCAHRHRKFDENRQVITLQNLALGQPLLDYEWYTSDIELGMEDKD